MSEKKDDPTRRVIPLPLPPPPEESQEEWNKQVSTGVTPEPPLTNEEIYASASWFRRFALWLFGKKPTGESRRD